MHPMVAHESSAGTAKKLWEGKPADAPKPMAIEQFVPFASDYKFFDDMGVRVFDNGHSYTGVNCIHPSIRRRRLRRGDERQYGANARQIVGTVRQHRLPNPMIKERCVDSRHWPIGRQDARRELDL
jgi:hypothetical protein